MSILSQLPAAPVQPPLTLHWKETGTPLPCRPLRAHSQRPYFEPAPWIATGEPGLPFVFGDHLRALCADIVQRCPELQHVDVDRLLFTVTQARNGHAHGLQARVTPLRFRNGQLLRRRNGVLWQVQRYFVDEREVMYLMTFCLPRFLDQDFDEKFVTLFHELYHISPAFDGDLRRHEGRYAIHSHSQRKFDDYMGCLARQYLADGADPRLHAFLRLDFNQLHRRHGSVLGVIVPRPKLIPLPQRSQA